MPYHTLHAFSSDSLLAILTNFARAYLIVVQKKNASELISRFKEFYQGLKSKGIGYNLLNLMKFHYPTKSDVFFNFI